MGRARFRTEAVVFDPIAGGDAPNNSIYSDSNNANAFSSKSSAGVENPVVAASDAFIKRAQNTTGVSITALKAVSKSTDGSIVLADSDSAQGQRVYGVALETIANNAYGRIGLVGRNVPGALTGLGFSVGDSIFISQTAGFTNDPNTFTDDNDTITFIGIADCADNTTSAIATDLVMIRQEILAP